MSNKQILLGIDFDGTICNTHPFPIIKGLRKGAKKYITKLNKEGYHITIWTCRTDKGNCTDASDAKNYLIQHQIPFDLFNENYLPLVKCFGTDSKKLSSDFYIDDKGLWPFGIPSWFRLYWLIKWRSFWLSKNKYILSHCKPEHFK